MAKGLFTATLAVLFESAPSLEQLERALADADLVGRRDAAPGNPWLGGDSLLVRMRPEVNGVVTLDIVDAPWPDGMGDPKSDPELFGAWSLGAFGPFTFPGALARAATQAVLWPEASGSVSRHRAFVRARASYVFGKGGDAPVIPEGYDAMAELFFVTDLCREVLKLEGAIGCFAPSGEVLLDRGSLEALLAEREQAELPPLDAWTNVRFFQLGDAVGWALMDTIGNDQLGVHDLEAGFPTETVNPDEVASWLRMVTLYAMNNAIADGDTIDGPGGEWQATVTEEGLAPAPRPTLRWVPTFVGDLPEGLLPARQTS